MTAQRKWWGLPPWLTKLRAEDAGPDARTLQELVKYAPPPAAAVDLVLTAEDKANGWTPETLAEYQAESDARAMNCRDEHDKQAPGPQAQVGQFWHLPPAILAGLTNRSLR